MQIFVRKTEWQERFGLHKHWWDSNIKVDRKTGLGSVNRIHVAYGTVAVSCKHSGAP